MLLVDIPPDTDTLTDMEDGVGDNGGLRHKNAVVYFPRPRIADPLNQFRLRSVGASGTLAGLYARTDGTRGVWKAPAGIEATLRGVQELDAVLTEPTAERATEVLLERIVVDARRGGEEFAAEDLTDEEIQALSDRLAEADPGAEIRLALACPSCEHPWSATFDPAALPSSRPSRKNRRRHPESAPRHPRRRPCRLETRPRRVRRRVGRLETPKRQPFRHRIPLRTPPRRPRRRFPSLRAGLRTVSTYRKTLQARLHPEWKAFFSLRAAPHRGIRRLKRLPMGGPRVPRFPHWPRPPRSPMPEPLR